MDHQAHIVFIDSHTESVCRTDNANISLDKILKNAFLVGRRETSVKVIDREIFTSQK